MASPLRRGIQIAIAVVITALLTPVLADAECVTVKLPRGDSTLLGVRDVNGRIIEPTLIFSGTVTATDVANYMVSFNVARVWKGQLRRETTFFVVPLVEGPGAGTFQKGSTYLVTTYWPVDVAGPEDPAPALPPGTVSIMFDCIGGLVPIAEASKELKRLGPGRLPQP